MRSEGGGGLFSRPGTVNIRDDHTSTEQLTPTGNTVPAGHGRKNYQLHLEKALVAISRMLITEEDDHLENTLGHIGEAVGADSVYLITIPPDFELVERGTDSGEYPSKSTWDLTGNGSFRYSGQELEKRILVWDRAGLGISDELRASLSNDGPFVLNADYGVDPIKRGSTAGSGAVSAIPILSTQDHLYGYLGFEFSGTDGRFDEQLPRLELIGDLFAAYFEKRSLEKAQAESEERWRKLVESNPEPILISIGASIQFINEKGAWLLADGHPDELVGRSLFDFVSAEDYQYVERIFRQLDIGKATEPKEFNLIRLDGEERIVEWFSAPIVHNGRAAAQIVLRDITRRKQAERALQESEIRFRAMADSAPVLIWMSDENGGCTFFNEGWLQFTGRSLEEDSGNGWTRAIHPDDRQRCFDYFDTHFLNREPFSTEFRLQRFDGEYRWVLDTGVPRYMPDGQFIGYIGSCVDITEQKRALQSIEESEDRYKTFVNTISEAIWRIEYPDPVDLATPVETRLVSLSQSGQLAECNQVLADLAGFDSPASLREQPIGTTLPFLRPELFRAFLASGYQLHNYEFVLDRDRERTHHLVINAVGTVIGDRLIRIWGSCVDVTERVELERQMVAALEQQQQRFGRDLHDGVGQLLTAVRMLSNNLAERFFTEGDDGFSLAKKVAKFAEEASLRVREIYSGLAPFQLFQDGLSVVLEELAYNTDQLPGISCTYEHDGETDISAPEVMVHLYRIVQEATNNALKYARANRITVTLGRVGDDVVLKIRDNGVGFDPEKQHNSKSLGLRSMYYRSRAVGGHLIIESSPNSESSGTLIQCTLPYTDRVKAKPNRENGKNETGFF